MPYARKGGRERERESRRGEPTTQQWSSHQPRHRGTTSSGGHSQQRPHAYGHPPGRKGEPSAGHGSQRVRNKAMKYVYKQHNKAGNRQRRPPPQGQAGPGWGILYEPQPPREQQTPTEAARGSKADTHAAARGRDRDVDFADLLNRHLLPRGTITSNTLGRDAPPQTPQPGTTQQTRQQAESNTAQEYPEPDPPQHVESPMEPTEASSRAATAEADAQASDPTHEDRGPPDSDQAAATATETISHAGHL